MLERFWQALQSVLAQEGKLNLSKGSLDGSFVAAKRGASKSTTGAKAKAILMVVSEARGCPLLFS